MASPCFVPCPGLCPFAFFLIARRFPGGDPRGASVFPCLPNPAPAIRAAPSPDTQPPLRPSEPCPGDPHAAPSPGRAAPSGPRRSPPILLSPPIRPSLRRIPPSLLRSAPLPSPADPTPFLVPLPALPFRRQAKLLSPLPQFPLLCKPRGFGGLVPTCRGIIPPDGAWGEAPTSCPPHVLLSAPARSLHGHFLKHLRLFSVFFLPRGGVRLPHVYKCRFYS